MLPVIMAIQSPGDGRSKPQLAFDVARLTAAQACRCPFIIPHMEVPLITPPPSLAKGCSLPAEPRTWQAMSRAAASLKPPTLLATDKASRALRSGMSMQADVRLNQARAGHLVSVRISSPARSMAGTQFRSRRARHFASR